MRLEHRVAIVTGAGQGIGAATARLFAEEGAAVVVANRTPDKGAAVAESILAAGGRAISVPTDVSSSIDIDRLVTSTLDTFGALDILVNNAAIEPGGPLLELAEETWDRVMAVNLKGPWLCARAAVPLMIRRGRGHIVNTSSVLGLHAFPNDAPYGSSKAGLIALTRAMALEWSGLGIHVNCIVPGSTDTPLMWGGIPPEQIPQERLEVGKTIPVGHVADPREIAEVSLWLCTEASSFVAGTAIIVDGGSTVRYPAPR